MAVSLTRFSWWNWGGKEKEPVPSGSSLNSSDWGLGMREMDSLKFQSVKGAKVASSSRKTKRKWHSREERRIDKEYDVVLVPSDGVCLSGSESDDSDWSIGWLEPHAPDFQSDDEVDDSFAVLVPCYRNDVKKSETEPSNQFLTAYKNFPDEHCDVLLITMAEGTLGPAYTYPLLVMINAAIIGLIWLIKYEVPLSSMNQILAVSKAPKVHAAMAFISSEFLKDPRMLLALAKVFRSVVINLTILAYELSINVAVDVLAYGLSETPD